MKKTYNLFLLICIALIGSGTGAFAQVVFNNGPSQNFTLCQDASPTSVNTLLSASGPTGGMFMWTVLSGPSHGTFNGLPSMSPSGPGMSPMIADYTPTSGYSGSDAVTIEVYDGSVTATTTINFTVTPIPVAITGNTLICTGTTSQLTDAAAGGTWTSGSTSIADVNPTTGEVTASMNGTAVITHTTGCGLDATTTVTVIPSPMAINGASALCQGSLSSYTNGTGFGMWTSSHPSMAMIGSGTGIVNGISAGTPTITYTTLNGCYATKAITVDPLPASISGTTNVCVGLTTELTDAGGGTWISSDPSVATIDLNTGIATGVLAGTTTISYTLSTGCKTGTVLTVDPLPGAITGTTNVCVGLITTLSDAGGGTWTSSDALTASADLNTGEITGVLAGTVTVTYTLSTGCITTTTVTVDPLPGTISGPTNVCEASTITLSDAGGGTWTSGTTTVATADMNTGDITGVLAGTSTVTYTLPTGCITTTTVTVDPLPSSITGTAFACENASSTLMNSGGGTWTSGSTAIATIGTSNGIVSAILAGTSTITYTLPVTGCMTTTEYTVNPLPKAISGNLNICMGGVTMLSDTLTGGTWVSSQSAVASINMLTGAVTPVTPGMTVITYTLPTSCKITAPATVQALPVVGLSDPSVCIGSVLTLTSSPYSSIVWQNNSTTFKTTSSLTGMATAGVSVGTGDGITPYGMYVTAGGDMYVADFFGNRIMKYGAGFNSSSTGTVVAANGLDLPASVHVDNAGNIYVANYNDNNIMMYPSGSNATTPGTVVAQVGLSGPLYVTVNAAGSIYVADNNNSRVMQFPSGSTSSTVGTMIASGFNNVQSLYLDPSDTMYVADFFGNRIMKFAPGSMSGTVVAGGNGAGSAANQFSYTSGIGVDISGNVYVADKGNNRVQKFPAGSTSATNGVTIAGIGTGASGSGTNALNSPINLFVDAYGTVYIADLGNNRVQVYYAGSVIDTAMTSTGGNYTATVTGKNGCVATSNTFNIHTVGSVTGTMEVCKGLTTTLADTSIGGAWSSSSTAIASIGTGGVATGNTAGSATITYTTPSGCIATGMLTVNPLPNAIMGASVVCLNSTTTLSDDGGGTWNTGTTATATIDAGGVLTGVATGTSDITYTLPVTGCMITSSITVLPLPAAHTVTGGGSYCANGTGVNVDLNGSDVDFDYQLYRGIVLVGTAKAGTGSPLNYGLQTGAGNYTVVATNSMTGCSSTMTSMATVSINPLPAVHTVTGGGSYCATGTGVNIGVNNSDNGIVYKLYRAGTFVPGTVNGNGSSISFGLSTIAATYKVTGTNSLTGCVNDMADSAIVIITPMVTPTIKISTALHDSVCDGSLDTFMVTTTNEGTHPVYQWSVNGANVGTNSTTFSYMPLNGDVVVALLVSDATCVVTPATATDEITMIALPVFIPAVTVTAYPGAYITKNQSDTLVATTTNAGPAPRYQWFKNGLQIPGATGSTYVSNAFNNKDSITCIVRGTGRCGLPSYNSIIMHVGGLGVNEINGGMNVTVIPNPNKGTFTVKGSFATIDDQEASIELTNMIGQVIYSEKVMTHNGEIAQQIQLNNSIASGMYLLNVRTTTDNKVLHVVIGQ